MNSRKCDICKVDVHRASHVKHLRSKKHLENIKQNEMILPEWLFQEPVETKDKKIYNPKPLKQLARDNVRLGDKQLKKELAKKMLNPYYFTDKILEVGFKISLDSHHIKHAYSKLTILPNYPEFGFETIYIKKFMKEISVICVRLINQNKFTYQTVFSARFDKQNEDDQVIDETEFFINLNTNHNLTQSDLYKIDFKSPLEHQIQQQAMKNSGW